jgi:hypothetical protein
MYPVKLFRFDEGCCVDFRKIRRYVLGTSQKGPQFLQILGLTHHHVPFSDLFGSVSLVSSCSSEYHPCDHVTWSDTCRPVLFFSPTSETPKCFRGKGTQLTPPSLALLTTSLFHCFF